MSDWITACDLSSIEPEGVTRFDHNAKTYAIYRSLTDEVFCTDGLCTHEAVHLSDGLVIDYEIECPKHSGAFDIRTGEALRLPACKNLSSYPARVENGVVHLKI
jgi:3-phenylpropionate/trans-cinnamate dioxygenase ferredoxin subunit